MFFVFTDSCINTDIGSDLQEKTEFYNQRFYLRNIHTSPFRFQGNFFASVIEFEGNLKDIFRARPVAIQTRIIYDANRMNYCLHQCSFSVVRSLQFFCSVSEKSSTVFRLSLNLYSETLLSFFVQMT